MSWRCPRRTARRDLEALGLAGVPVYSTAGRGGGWSLVGGARTDLSGLTVDEARALFLAAGPATAATPGVQAALRKLLAALPAPLRKGAEAAGSALVVDAVHLGRARRRRSRSTSACCGRPSSTSVRWCSATAGAPARRPPGPSRRWGS